MNIQLTFTKTEEETNFYEVTIDAKNLDRKKMDKYQLEEYDYYLEKNDSNELGNWLSANISTFIPDDSIDGITEFLTKNGTYKDSKTDENIDVFYYKQ